MGFFGRSGHQDEEQDDSLARIEGGGIPLQAEERLKALGADGSMFTSGLSVNEFALLDKMAPRPLAQVMGASVVRVGWQYLPALPPGQIVNPGGWSGGPRITGRALQNMITDASPSQVRSYQWRTDLVCELNVTTEAWNLARRRALNRLSEEAMHVGADAVVGVHLHRGEHDLGKGAIDYVVSGTAIRLPGAKADGWSVLTGLSVQDYWRLAGMGQEPVGLLATTVVVFASPARATRVRRLRTTWQNQELAELSRGFHSARETVRAVLLGQVADARGVGAVGVELSHSVHREKLALASSLQTSNRRGWQRGALGVPYRVTGRSDTERRGWVITMHAAGTAIRPRRGTAHPPVKTALRMGAR
jgi:uncharacterized protein YbjQ (UPF0145 family)